MTMFQSVPPSCALNVAKFSMASIERTRSLKGEGTVKIPIGRANVPLDETDEAKKVVEAGDTGGEADDD